MKIYIICSVPAQIYIWEKSCFCDIDQNGLSQSDSRIFNQPFIQNKSMKQRNSLHVATNSQKLKVDRKFLVGNCQKWVQPKWSLDSKIDCIYRMNRWN